MNSDDIVIEIADDGVVDVEKGLPRSEKGSQGLTPSPAATSTTAFSQVQSTESGRSKWSQSFDTLLCRLSRFKASEETRAQSPSNEPAVEDPTTIMRTLESCPEGYPQLAAFLDSDENLMLFRRFGYLQSRILLHKQDELRALETRLDVLDKIDSTDATTSQYLKCRDRDDKRKDSPRKALLKNIEVTFKEYADLLGIARAMVAMNKPAKRDYVSVKNYFLDEAPLNAEDEYYIYRKEDIVTLKPGRENAWLDHIIEIALQKLTCRPTRYLFCSSETRAKWRTGNMVYYTRSRINILVTCIITAVILILVIVPVYALWRLSLLSPSQSGPNTTSTIGILLLFTLFFSGVLSFFTRAKRHEIFGAAVG